MDGGDLQSGQRADDDGLGGDPRSAEPVEVAMPAMGVRNREQPARLRQPTPPR
jgi:hypothetical protein